MRIPFQLSIIASAVVLAGCGGGGGGPVVNNGGGNSYVRNSVSYATPTQVNSYTPLQGTGVNAVVSDVFTKDLNNDSVDEVVVGGRLTQPATAATWRNTNIQLYGWNTGSFSNETSTWFSGGDNEIIGTEPSIKFGDFDGDGNIDMFMAPSTDTNSIYGNAVVFRNSGSDSFTRSTIPVGNTWSHDSWVGDLNGDGRDDIVMTDYGTNMSVNYGNADGTFSSFTGGHGASGISIADYLGNGTQTIILTDTQATGNSDTKLYSFDVSSGNLVLNEIGVLPESRFYQSKWDAQRALSQWAPHAIRNFTLDFNGDGLQDVVVIDLLSVPGADNSFSEMQFLRNDGGGNFTDVTDNVLVNYDTSTQGSYQPILVDINNDGLDDILLSSGDTISDSGYNDATRVLVQTNDGKFVQKYENVFKDFYNQIHANVNNALDWGQPINIVQGPNNEKYLFSTVVYEDSGNIQAKTYLAKIGSTGTVTPQAVADVINATWPYLSGPEVNEVLASTSPLSFEGTQIVDLSSAMQPSGELQVNHTRISGSLSVSGLNNSIVNRVTALDSIGRNYDVDLTALANSKNSTISAVSDSRAVGFTATGDNNVYSFGTDSSTVLDNSSWRFGFGISKQSTNPWVNFSGMFGKINSTQVVEFDINKEYNNGVWHRAGLMQYQTDFDPGLVTRVDDLWAGYAVIGYKEQGLNLYGGLKPTLFSGSVGLRLPTDVDNNGNLMYTDHTVSVRNRALGFMGIDYKFVLDITKALKYNISAQIDSAGNKQGNFTAGLPW